MKGVKRTRPVEQAKERKWRKRRARRKGKERGGKGKGAGLEEEERVRMAPNMWAGGLHTPRP